MRRALPNKFLWLSFIYHLVFIVSPNTFTRLTAFKWWSMLWKYSSRDLTNWSTRQCFTPGEKIPGCNKWLIGHLCQWWWGIGGKMCVYFCQKWLICCAIMCQSHTWHSLLHFYGELFTLGRDSKSKYLNPSTSSTKSHPFKSIWRQFSITHTLSNIFKVKDISFQKCI